jgi:hypothetical protein
MVDTSLKLRYLNMFNAYPLVDTKSMPDLKMERAKMVLVARAISRTTGLNEYNVLSTMCDIRGLSFDTLPNIMQACNTTGVRFDFINDYNKLQYLYEKNKVMDTLPRFLISVNPRI